MAAIDPNIDLMARTMVAENANASPEEYEAIANVMRNRLQSGEFGKDMGSVIHGRTARGGWQFTPWSNPSAKNYPTKIDPNSPAYQSAYKIASDRMSGNADDPTGGAVYYYSPSGMPKGAPPPSFAKGREGQQIGAHKFYGPVGAVDESNYAHLITGKPKPSQVAGEDVAPSGPSGVDEGAYAHLITGKPAPPKLPEPPEPPPEPDLSGGFGLVAKGYQKNPVATAAIGSTLALPLAATGVAGAGVAGGAAMSALPPFWQALLGGSTALYGAPWAVRKIGEFAGAPQTGEAVGSLMDIIHGAGKAFVP